jgi:SAM-dependent methyltransferase
MIQPKAFIDIHDKVLSYLFSCGLDLNNLKILDAAAGNGYLSYHIIKNYPKVFINQVDCDLQNLIENGFSPIYCDLNGNLPFSDNYFDIVISLETIEHLENPYHFIRELTRVVQDDGMIILSTPNVHSAKSRIRNFLYCLPCMFDYIRNDGFGQHISQVSFPMINYISTINRLTITELLPAYKGYNSNFKFLYQIFNYITLAFFYFSSKFRKGDNFVKHYDIFFLNKFLKSDVFIVVFKKSADHK